ncbi:hypothetical protein MKJ01_16160 [Chryseobacterium sp. SSA4.19]|uniref:hypothetical protein n=1 Tax=Chryseobacterium sp. SSA4.19 TaxID=2919915 RepID=UPI001F4EC1DF|nr:hypothetical protein [Chryseobacterium sp. SSA4.19]MCJ8155300.1 hypothetical protein [Chryseobacterium sp. SSA4.19]
MKTVYVKSMLLWMFLLSFSCHLFSQEPQKYIPFRKGKLWGLCDANRFIVIQPQYNSISGYDPSAGGFHVEQSGKFGIIGSNGAPVMQCISDEPIFVNGDSYVVFDGFSYYNYSMKTKMKLDPYIMPERFPVNDRWSRHDDPYFDNKALPASLTWNDLDDTDREMLIPYEDENLYRINFKINFLEILSGDAQVGIYIPEIKKLYKSTPEIAYVGWQLYNGKPYILTTDSSGLFGMADEFSNEVYPVKYISITLSDPGKLVFLSEPDPQREGEIMIKTILPNNILNGRFEPSGTVWRNGHEYRLYYTIINGEKNYAAEDGTLYFEG